MSLFHENVTDKQEYVSRLRNSELSDMAVIAHDVQRTAWRISNNETIKLHFSEL